ncbi:MAG: MFS transporter [Alphaproteobacteria bacterium]|nr:MFS transporter [Alphaproteobacteria bacterium]
MAREQGLGPLALMADGAFRRVWLAGGVVGLVRWFDTVVAGIYVFDVTGSAGTVAVVAAMRLLPMIGGAFLGAVAERFALQLLLLIGFSCVAATYGVLATLAFTGLLAVWHVGLGLLLVGIYGASEMAVRRTLAGEIAGQARISAAMGLDWGTVNATRLAGPLAGGALYQAFGIGATYATCGALYGLTILLILGLKAGTTSARSTSPKSGSAVGLAAMAATFTTVRQSKLLLGILAATVVVNFFGYTYSSMVPVIGKDVLFASPTAVGLLVSAEGAGALIGSLALANLARPGWFGRVLLLGAVVMQAGVLGFGLSRSYELSLAALLLVGLGSASFATMQSTLILTEAPPDRRSRLMGLLTTVIGIGQIGLLHIGLVAASFGAPLAVTLASIEGLALITFCAWRWPALWRA